MTPALEPIVEVSLMSTPQVVTMSPKSSVPQAASIVSQVLMSDMHERRSLAMALLRLLISF